MTLLLILTTNETTVLSPYIFLYLKKKRKVGTKAKNVKDDRSL